MKGHAVADRPKILVVDDEGIIAMSLQAKLSEMGYDVPQTAGSGEEAIQLVEELKPDLVLMDIRLDGGMDGIEAAGIIRRKFDTPLVYLSAFSDEATLERAKLTEPFGYVLKPVVDRELRIVIEIALFRFKAERALQLSEEKYRVVLESANDSILTSDNVGNIVYLNKAAERTFGYENSDLIGRPLGIILPYFPQPSGLMAIFSSGETEPVMSLKGKKKDGGIFPLEVSLASWKTVDGIFYTLIVRDITERKRAEEALRRNTELQEINRAKDEFLAVVSHELRTPLTAMLGWTKLLTAGKLTPEESTRALAVIERNIMAQKKLVEDLLDVARVVPGKLMLDARPLDLLPVVAAAIDAVRPSAAAKNIQFTHQFEPGEVFVHADPTRLQQIVYNLLSNSIKFTPAGGCVGTRVEKSGNDVLIVVTDNGIGIDRDFLPHLFERFRQADASTTRLYQGLGLGLSIVRHLTELHGGTVTAQSTGKNTGSTFTVRLPLTRGRPAAPAKETAAAPNGIRGPLWNLRILVVEDNADSRELLAAVLQKQGATVTTAATVEDALPIFDRCRPDLLVSDIEMPGEDGYSLIKKLRARAPDNGGATPAIALTAYSRNEDRDRALSSGFQAHLSKPPDPAELVALAANVARQKAHSN